MYKKFLLVSVIVVLTAGIFPVVAEAVEEVPWGHLVDSGFDADKKPVDVGKPPKDDPAPPPPQYTPWGVGRIDADLVWSSSTGEGVKVAVLDTGIDNDHPDLDVAGGVNYVPQGRKLDTKKWDDDNGHGTHVAGTIAALNNDQGVVGVAPGVNIYAVKVLDRTGSGSLTWIINGLNWAIANDMDIVSMSLSTDYDYADFRNAIQSVYDAGIVIIAAAGNDGTVVDYPAAYSTVVAVSATDSGDNIPYWSNRGSQIEVAAPGVSIPSTWNDGGYKTISGTSMACPHVTGVAALVIGISASWTVEGIRSALHDAEDVNMDGWDMYYGHGIVDAVAATT
ncbi:MAG: S8 family peptidase [Thermoplasmatota archaeon]